MDYEQEALDFIARPENIGAALEIARLVDQMRPRLQKDFWVAVTTKAESILLASELAKSWQVIAEHQNYRSSYAGLVIAPKEFEYGQRYLRVRLEQGRRQEEYPLYYGVKWDRDFSWKQMNVLKSLRNSLISQGFGEENNWWIGYKYLGTYHMHKQEFLLRMGTDQEALVAEMASQLFELLETNLKEIEAINNALKQPPHLPA